MTLTRFFASRRYSRSRPFWTFEISASPERVDQKGWQRMFGYMGIHIRKHELLFVPFRGERVANDLAQPRGPAPRVGGAGGGFGILHTNPKYPKRSPKQMATYGNTVAPHAENRAAEIR